MIQTKRSSLCGRGHGSTLFSPLDDGTCVTRSRYMRSRIVSRSVVAELSACNSLVRQTRAFRIRRPNHRANAFSRLFHTLCRWQRTSSRLLNEPGKRRPVLLFYARVFYRYRRGSSAGRTASGPCLHCRVGGWSLAQRCVRRLGHEPWALAASNFESLALGLH